MKTLKLLNKAFLSILVILLFFVRTLHSEEQPVDIWNIDKSKLNQKSGNDNEETNQKIKNENLNQSSTFDVLKLEPQNPIKEIKFDQNLNSQKIKILGLYDPDDFGLSINMWSNSDGEQLKNIFAKLNKMSLSQDAKELMNISLLTNAYQPQKNISEKEFIEIKSEWLIKNSDLDLIEKYLIKIKYLIPILD